MPYVKTDAGRQEIEQRTRKLPAALRSILLMIDGQRDDAELATLIESLRAPADTLQQLQEMGLVEQRSAAGEAAAGAVAATAAVAAAVSTEAVDRYKALYGLASETIRAHLGLRGYFLQLKVERCATAEELEALLQDVADALAKAKSDALAKRWLNDARTILEAEPGRA
ncbi:MAG: hypothetical protein QM761_08190 [Pseudoxanthomonas sp.]